MPASEVVHDEEQNPLSEALARIYGGKVPLSKSTGTSTGVIGYDPDQSFRPQGDTINISGSPGTGASTSETWSHDIALENLKREQLQFEYEQQQAAIANQLKQQDAQRAAAAAALQQAEGARAAALGPEQLKAAQLGNQATAQQMAIAKQTAANQQNAADIAYYEKTGIRSPTMQKTLASAATGSLGNITPLSQTERLQAQKYMSAGLSPQQAYQSVYYGPTDTRLADAASGYNPISGRYYEGIADMNKNNQRRQDAYYTSIGVSPATIQGAFAGAVGNKRIGGYLDR